MKRTIYYPKQLLWFIVLHFCIDVHSCFAVFVSGKVLDGLWINTSIEKIGNVSVPQLMRSTWKLTVGQYLFCFFLTKWLAAFICGIWVMLAMLFARRLFTGALGGFGSYCIQPVHPICYPCHQQIECDQIRQSHKFTAHQ
mgnify:CR=1 FL=1